MSSWYSAQNLIANPSIFDKQPQRADSWHCKSLTTEGRMHNFNKYVTPSEVRRCDGGTREVLYLSIPMIGQPLAICFISDEMIGARYSVPQSWWCRGGNYLVPNLWTLRSVLIVGIARDWVELCNTAQLQVSSITIRYSLRFAFLDFFLLRSFIFDSLSSAENKTKMFGEFVPIEYTTFFIVK